MTPAPPDRPDDNGLATPTSPPLRPTPWSWRLGIAAVIILLALGAYVAREQIGVRGQSWVGIVFFFGLVAMFSRNLRGVNWRTVAWGVAIQVILAILVLKVGYTRNRTPEEMEVLQTRHTLAIIGAGSGGQPFQTLLIAQAEPPKELKVRPVYVVFEKLGEVVKALISFSDKGAEFVFGNLARPGDIALNPGVEFLFIFAFKALPPILFMSALFTVLYHYGVLQWCVRMMARGMVHLMNTSGAETLSVAANVFMGQTEAPLIVKPYVPRMTNSELFTLMTSGMAHISGGMMVVYINYGADPVAVLTTCVMACPCSLYLAKLFLPETSTPETAGTVHTHAEKSPYVNGIDAAAAGTGDGLRLALNVAAMLIVFIAFVAMFDGILREIKPMLIALGVSEQSLIKWPDDLSLRHLFGWLFAPAAFLMGVDVKDAGTVGTLLGSKLAINEHYAYLQMKAMKAIPGAMSNRSYQLTAFALTGFANFSSIGIQLGGIGALAPERRHDLARLGGRALFVGFVATLLNASIAGVLLED
jgi:CNT family concentrative nucleoside transporter